jgi:ribosomal 30S subunit maturation factor RimM
VDPEPSDLSNEALLLVGRVARAHGIRGQVIVNPETDFMEDRFRVGQIVRVGPADRTRTS